MKNKKCTNCENLQNGQIVKLDEHGNCCECGRYFTDYKFGNIYQTQDSVHKSRKERPVYSGVLKYFPDALMEVAYCSWVGNEQHNKGEPLHWDRSKSTDEADALLRHLMESGTIDSDGVRHSVKVAWRALALAQKEIELDKKDIHKRNKKHLA